MPVPIGFKGSNALINGLHLASLHEETRKSQAVLLMLLQELERMLEWELHN